MICERHFTRFNFSFQGVSSLCVFINFFNRVLNNPSKKYLTLIQLYMKNHTFWHHNIMNLNIACITFFLCKKYRKVLEI